MSEPFMGEIRYVPFNFPPKGWAFCNGQLLPINQNQALFSLLGTMYGGDGRVNFGLPNLQGRTAVHFGSADYGTGYPLGQVGGEYQHTLTQNEMPQHSHPTVAAGTAATSATASGDLWSTTPVDTWATPANRVAMAPQVVSNAGGSQPHVNMPPYLGLVAIIALQGIFPSQN